MKNHLKTWSAGILATLAVASLCLTARADFVGGAFTNGTAAPTTWDQWNGQNYFYTSVSYSGNLGTIAYVPQLPNPANSFGYLRNPQYYVESQVFKAPAQRYKLQAISVLMAGVAAGNCTMHLFDITGILTMDQSDLALGITNNNGAHYDIPGSLMGNGNGLTFTNGGTAVNTTNQWIFTLSNGTNGNDADIVIGDQHWYALEIWSPHVSSGNPCNWYRTGTSGNPADTTGMMGGGEYSTRRTIEQSGNGGNPRDYAMALFGTTTSDPLTVNTNPPVGLTNHFVDTFLSSAYSGGQITNKWTNWFGDAVVYPSGLSWSTDDASGKANSGSLKIDATFGTGDNQFLVMNGFSNAPLQGVDMVRFEANVKFAPGSGTTVNGTLTNYGHLQFGTESNFAGQFYLPGAVEIAQGNTNWNTAMLPFDAQTTATNFNTLMYNVLVHIYGNWYSSPVSGASTMYLDNVKWVGLANPISPPPTMLSVADATPALRFFTPNTSTAARENLGTFYYNMSFYDPVTVPSYPFPYSWTITNFPPTNAGQFEFHMFLVPTNYLRTDYGGNPYANWWVDNDTTNLIAVRIQPTGSNYMARFDYKVNLAPGFPNLTLATLLSSKAVGTWSLTFANQTNATLAGPGGVSTNFNMPPADAALFANPVAAIFGAVGNNGGGSGRAVDINQISIGPSGQLVLDNFAQDFSLDMVSTWSMAAANPECVWLTGPAARYWVSWTTPDFGYSLLESTNVVGWRPPTFWNATAPVQNIIGNQRVALLQTNHVPSGKLKALYFGSGH